MSAIEVVGSNALPLIVQPVCGPQRPRSNWNVRSVGPGTSTSCSASRSGTALSSRPRRTTRKRITSAAEPSPSELTIVTSVPTGTCAKSTTTSNRSPGAASTLGRTTGAASRPLSEPICVNGRSGAPGTRSARPKRRALDALRIRSR